MTDVWWSIEVLDGAFSAEQWRVAHSAALLEAAVTDGPGAGVAAPAPRPAVPDRPRTSSPAASRRGLIGTPRGRRQHGVTRFKIAVPAATVSCRVHRDRRVRPPAARGLAVAEGQAG